MIITPEQRKTILESLIFMLRSAYTEQEIIEHFSGSKEMAQGTLSIREEKLYKLKELISIFKI